MQILAQSLMDFLCFALCADEKLHTTWCLLWSSIAFWVHRGWSSVFSLEHHSWRKCWPLWMWGRGQEKWPEMHRTYSRGNPERVTFSVPKEEQPAEEWLGERWVFRHRQHSTGCCKDWASNLFSVPWTERNGSKMKQGRGGKPCNSFIHRAPCQWILWSLHLWKC